jgi:hypothetical protein
MEKKELSSMSKHRGLFLVLGLAAMIGVMASEARAETLTLTVYAGSGTGGAVIYTTTGGSQAVTANLTALNSDLTAAGFGAYQFTNLGGSSNNPGTSGPVGGFILTSGNMTVTPGGSGEGTPITVVLTEDGFSAPSSGAGASLFTAATANYAGTAAGPASTQTDQSQFTDSTPQTITGGVISQPSNGTQTDSHSTGISQGLPAYVVPYTLTNILVIQLTADPAGSGGSNGFSGKTSVISSGTIPEPASLVMMLTGMPLPLVVLGLLRRRRAAA